MTITSLIAPQLPLLRRYARALSGTQTRGDACVVAMLETLVADHSLFDKAADSREETFRLFSRVWNSTPADGGSETAATNSIHDRRLEAITPLPRQAFLLTAMEGFSRGQAARILGVAPEELERLIVAAGKEIGAQVASKVVIIEDEPAIALDLEHLVAGLGHVVVGPARTRSAAVEMVLAERPGLVLADIRLADGSSGLDAVNEILQGLGMPVIFITAYPESLLTGVRPEPTFLVSKPFRADTVSALISQALFFDQHAKPAARSST